MYTFCLAAIAVLVLLVMFAPGFLFTADVPRKADAVVLFVGPGNESRLDEAKKLIKEGYARYLIIPNQGEVLSLNQHGELVKLTETITRDDLIRKVRLAVTYKKHYENTHIEALEARRMMDDLGVRSAMLVSSGYHMRRIRLISGRVFDAKKNAVRCNPARWQKPFEAGDWLDNERRKIIVSEYVKIGWFLLYGVLS